MGPIWAITETQGFYSDTSYDLSDKYYLSERAAEVAVLALEREGAIHSLRSHMAGFHRNQFPCPVQKELQAEQDRAEAQFAPNTANRRVSIRHAREKIYLKYKDALSAESKAREEHVAYMTANLVFDEVDIQRTIQDSDVRYAVVRLEPAEGP